MRRVIAVTFAVAIAWLVGGRALARDSAPPLSIVDLADTDASLPAHADPIANYTIRASLDPSAHTLHGEATITWRNASRIPQRELYVHLYMNAFKTDHTVFRRVPLSGFRGASASTYGHIDVTRFVIREMDATDVWPARDPTSPGDADDETDIRVPLPTAVAPGATLTIDVEWDEQLPPISFRTGYLGSFHMVGQWFPKLARLEPDGTWAHFPFHSLSEFYADFGSYDVTIDTPENVVVGATGRLDREARAGGRVERRYVQDDVHDFGFTAWDGFRELTARSDEGVDIRCLYPPGYERAASVQVEAARYGLAYFGKAFGRYPYATLTLVHPPAGATEAGGMEYPTLITTGGAWYFPFTGVRILDVVTIHELGHQWFYGLVASNEHQWPFLDEGVNTYAEVSALEARFPQASALDVLGFTVDLTALNRAGAADRAPDAPVAQSAPAFLTGSEYVALVYRRTSTILATLGRVYGEDDARRAVGRYARRYRFGHPGPDELIATFDEVLGAEAAASLRVALFDRGTVDYLVESFASTAADTDLASPAAAKWTGSVVVRRRGALRFPVDIDLIGEDGATQRVRWDAREVAARLPYAGETKLAAVIIDPERRVLLDDNLANNALRTSPPRVANRVLERALFAAELVLTALLP